MWLSPTLPLYEDLNNLPLAQLLPQIIFVLVMLQPVGQGFSLQLWNTFQS